MTRHQLRAARALLAIQQETLAHEADVGVASVRRFENGNEVGEDIVLALRDTLVAHGVILIAPGTIVDGQEVGEGVVLASLRDRSSDTKNRHALLDIPLGEVAKIMPEIRREGVGRRVRSPVPDDALAKRAPGQRRGRRRKGLVPPKE